jgi:hypothetical protein
MALQHPSSAWFGPKQSYICSELWLCYIHWLGSGRSKATFVLNHGFATSIGLGSARSKAAFVLNYGFATSMGLVWPEAKLHLF